LSFLVLFIVIVGLKNAVTVQSLLAGVEKPERRGD